jgi:NAD(P)-dependent dehydrogenase (short-subunit alcohol dehydrogenase family)
MTTTIDLRGRAALVTGGSRGIGRAVAELLAAHGAQVAVHYQTNERAAHEALAALTGEGHAALAADLGDPSAALALADRAAAALGRLDIVVNNAGIYAPHDIGALTAQEWQRAWDRHLAVNLTGPAHVIHGAVRHLDAAGGGHIVNVSSRGAFRGEPQAPAYGAAKAGLNALGQSLAVALAPQKIRVVSVAPGWVETDMTREHLAGPDGDEVRSQSPWGRTATVQEVAWTVLLAVSGRADALTGGIIDVNVASYLRT